MKVPEYAGGNYAGVVVPRCLAVGIVMVTMCIAPVTWAGMGGDGADIPACVRAVAVSKDGKTAVTGDAEGVIRVWDLAERSLQRSIDVPGFKGNSFPCYAISEDGKHVLVGHRDAYPRYGTDSPLLASRNTLTLWDLKSGKMIRGFANKGECVGGVALSPDGKLALVTEIIGATPVRNSNGGFPLGVGTLRLWDVSMGQPRHTLLKRSSDYGAITFSRDGKLCAVGGGIGQRVQRTRPGWDVKIWDTASGKEVGSIPAEQGSDGVSCIGFSPDSTYIVAAVGHRMIRMWNRVSGKLIWSWGDSARLWTAHCITFSPDGKTVLLCGPERDFLRRIPKAAEPGRLVILDAVTGKEKIGFTGTAQWVAACAFTPDGKHILAAAALGTQYVDATNGNVKFLLRK